METVRENKKPEVIPGLLDFGAKIIVDPVTGKATASFERENYDDDEWDAICQTFLRIDGLGDTPDDIRTLDVDVTKSWAAHLASQSKTPAIPSVDRGR